MPDDSRKPASDIELDRFRNFFAVIGYAITQWSHIDALLFELLHFALGTSAQKAAIVFYRSSQIGDHLVLVDKLMRCSLSRKQLTRWKAIFKLFETHLPFRNQIAHNRPREKILHLATLAEVLTGEPSHERLLAHEPWELRADISKLFAGTKDAAAKPIKFEDISKHIEHVTELYRQMRAFRESLPARARKQRATRQAPQSPPKKGLKKRRRRASAKQ
jgi:hypothetical protein